MTAGSTLSDIRSVPSRLAHRIARVVLAATVVSLMLPVAGALYEAMAARSDAGAAPSAGRLIDVGGFRLHIYCVGSGSPTVILDAGLGGTSLDWSLVQPELGTTTRVCAYDRAGMGWSDPSPHARTPEQLADELHQLLTKAKIGGPYVLVAHSLSGKSARLFALNHRQEVAGMVLVDARSEYVDDRTTSAENSAFLQSIASQGGQYALARQFGIVRLLGAQLAGTSNASSETRKRIALLATNETAIHATAGEAYARAASDEALRTQPPMGDLPLIVLASDQSLASLPNWPAAQRQQAALSSVGKVVIASGSSHAVPWDRPDLVISSVRAVIAAARGR